jgi:hypothetical protein
MLVLQVADQNSQAIEAVLDETLFFIVLDWNSSNQNWTMGIRNSAYQSIISGISLVPNFPLTYQFRYSDMPAGELVVLYPKYRNGPIPRDGFIAGAYQLCYVTADEMLTTWQIAAVQTGLISDVV